MMNDVMITYPVSSENDPQFAQLKTTLERERGQYVRLDTLSKLTGIAPDVIVLLASQHGDVVRSSYLRTDDATPVFTLNTPLSGVLDAVNAMRQVVGKKY